MIEHCLIYCCLGGKSLYKNYLSGKGEFVLAAKKNVLPRANVLNGAVCFSCDIEKVEYWGDSGVYSIHELEDLEVLGNVYDNPELSKQING